MIRFFTLVYGTKTTSVSISPLECTIDQAQARVDEVMQKEGLGLIYIHLLESVKGDLLRGEFVEVETE